MDSYTVTIILASSPWTILKVYCLVTCSGKKTSKACKSTYKRFVPSPEVETSKAQGFGTSVIPSITLVFSFFQSCSLRTGSPPPFFVVQASKFWCDKSYQPRNEALLYLGKNWWIVLLECWQHCVLWKTWFVVVLWLVVFCWWWWSS